MWPYLCTDFIVNKKVGTTWLLILPSFSSRLPSLKHLLLLTQVLNCPEKNIKIEEKHHRFVYSFVSCLILLYAKFWLGSITENNLSVYAKAHQGEMVLCTCIYAGLKILPTVEVCRGWSGMKTASWERNLNVISHTFNNVIQMVEKFSFVNLALLGISSKRSHFLFWGQHSCKCSCEHSVLRGLKAARPVSGLTRRK